MWWWQYCLVNFTSISMHRIHIILFDMQNWKIYLLLWLCLKWWGTMHIKYAGFLLKWLQLLYEGRKKNLSYFYCFCLYFVYSVYSWAQKSAGETSMGISADSASQHMETQLQRAPKQGKPNTSVCQPGLFEWNSIQTWNSSCSTTKWDSKCSLHMTLWYF